MLDSSLRPTIWRLQQPAEFDIVVNGWIWEKGDGSHPRDFDSSIEGLGRGGHTYGDKLSAEQRDDLIRYLQTL